MQPQKVIVAGGRNFNDYEKLKQTLDNSPYPIGELVSGGASGADSLGERWAKENNIPCKVFKADWHLHGKAAGPIRNGEMAKYADALIAFWDFESRGTKSMISLAEKQGLKVFIVRIAKDTV